MRAALICSHRPADTIMNGNNPSGPPLQPQPPPPRKPSPSSPLSSSPSLTLRSDGNAQQRGANPKPRARWMNQAAMAPDSSPSHGPSSSSGPGPLERAIAAARQHQPLSASGGPALSPSSSSLSADPGGLNEAVLASFSSAPATSETAASRKSTKAAAAASAAPVISSAASDPVADDDAAEADGSGALSSLNKHRYKKRNKKYNNFNIFFMLERQLLLQSRGGGINAVENPIDTSDSPLVRRKELRLPPLCRRYNHLPLTSNWFLELLANQNKKRPHRKSHGLIPFKELAQTVAKNYREIDDETQAFVNEVAERLGWHCEEMEALEEKERKEAEKGKKKGKGGPRGAGHHAGSHPRPSGAEKKRKDAPVVSVAGPAATSARGAIRPSLSQDEAATVQQLVGMKAHSPNSAHHGTALPRPPYAPPPHGTPLEGPHYPGAYPPMSVAAPHYPLPPPSVAASHDDSQSEWLKIELARAMSARVESERRILLLKEQMSRHQARTHHQRNHSPTHHPAPHPSPAETAVARAPHLPPPDFSPSGMRATPPGAYERYLSLMGGEPQDYLSLPHQHHRRDCAPHAASASRKAPVSSRPEQGAPVQQSDYEKELLREAFLRRIIPAPSTDATAGGPSPSSLTIDARLADIMGGGPSLPLPNGACSSSAEARSEGTLKKRARYSHTNEDDKAPISVKRLRSEDEAEAQGSGRRAPGREPLLRPCSVDLLPRPPSATTADDIGYYAELYSRLARSREADGGRCHHDPGAARDLAMFDSLAARGLGGRTSSRDAADEYRRRREQALLAEAARGHGHPRPPAPHAVMAQYSPHEPVSRGDLYSGLISRLAGHHTAARPAPSPAALEEGKRDLMDMVHAAAQKSQFGLSYNEIMDVWKEMNDREKAGGVAIGGHNHGAGEEGKDEEPQE